MLSLGAGEPAQRVQSKRTLDGSDYSEVAPVRSREQPIKPLSVSPIAATRAP